MRKKQYPKKVYGVFINLSGIWGVIPMDWADCREFDCWQADVDKHGDFSCEIDEFNESGLTREGYVSFITEFKSVAETFYNGAKTAAQMMGNWTKSVE